MHRRNIAVVESAAVKGLEIEIRFLDHGAPTAKAAAGHLGVDVGAIANSLIFRAIGRSGAGRTILVMTSGAHRVDTAHLAEVIDVARIERATPDQVLKATGQIIGGVAPCGHPAPVETYVDRALSGYPQLWAAAGTVDSMFPLSYEELVRLTDGTEVEVVP
ncbi:YbaK/EbsC family protein [Sediminivirga luteola]|uniref:YbaK/EbsC family protein n=1 Tax=Sediminivirga luteola TaxID=1774748 RepID=UPI001F5A27E4|nr:YbaK/EbsC family protein [Sediminivirga luteola]MCI2266788.1 YbaK/EbsC family protein [Sediminivirga luteola]